MKKILFLLMSIFLFSCGSSLQTLRKQDTLLLNISDSKEKVISLLGKPSMQNDTLFRYNKQGLLLYFKQQRLREIICTQLFDFEPFSGTFIGIKIGETYPKVIQTLGNKFKRVQTNTDIYALIWKSGKINIEVEFWDNSEVNQRVHYELIDTSKRIRVFQN